MQSTDFKHSRARAVRCQGGPNGSSGYCTLTVWNRTKQDHSISADCVLMFDAGNQGAFELAATSCGQIRTSRCTCALAEFKPALHHICSPT